MRCLSPEERFDLWREKTWRLWCRICQSFEPYHVTEDRWIRCGRCGRVLIAAPVIPGMVE